MLSLMASLVGLPQASTTAAAVDQLFDFLFGVRMVGLVGVTLAIILFAVRYRRSKSNPDKTPYIEGHTPTEVGISAVLFVVVMIIFYWGWIDYKTVITMPANAMEINVTARQWAWQFEYTNGRKMIGEIVVPKGKPVRLLMSSLDVIHSFYVPDFRIKQDVVPGAYTALWFEAPEVGEHQIFCAEYCGTSHSKMLGTVRVVDEAEYAQWQLKWEYALALGIGDAEAAPAAPTDAVAAAPSASALQPAAAQPQSPPAGGDLAARGKQAYTDKGCNACHTINGDKGIGPTFKGLFGSSQTFEDGTTATADENYLRESIMDPQKRIVKGFQPVMPTFRGTLTDDEVNALVAYIKSLKKLMQENSP